ncbi:MAG: two-component system, OmpR family, sensor histidine kinase VicK [Patescibacteria group bacterium]|nr:two-component system, OmpR family, sensor histidine kinase VicK [Patescibacteria group bacterium]
MFGFKQKSSKDNQEHVLAKSLFDEKTKSDIILNAIDDGVVLIDANKIIQSCNPAAATITGWAQKDAIGVQYDSVIKLVNDKNEAYQPIENPFEKIYQSLATVRDNHANIVTNNNAIKAADIAVTPLLDQQKNITGAVAIIRDVTSEREAESQRAEFISTASHEMRTPVAAIEGYLALALNDKVANIDQKAREYLEKAHSSTQHLGKLFQDLLTSAKAEDGRLQNHPVVVEMGAYLEQLTEDLRFAAQKKGLNMEYLIGADGQQKTNNVTNAKVVRPLYYCHIDPDRLREVITNLFDNAAKYTDTGTISIGIAGDDKVVQIRVQDTGQGIPADDISHLFEKFYRVDTSATRTVGGTGLGLFICRKIIELYNGRIWVESQLNKGSTFYINLPRLGNEKAQQLKSQEESLANTVGALQ